MLFCTQKFFLFFLAVFVLYWAMPWRRGRVWLLLLASFWFYASWSQWLALLIAASSTMDYFLARGMDASSRTGVRRVLLCISIVVNLGLLCYFKYANFFLHSLDSTLHALGLATSLPVLQVILPIGISVYTFEAINYTVDVYRRAVPAERSLANFMLFITFFPHLVAGPIVRARDFLPQIHRAKRWDWARHHLGVQLLVLGLFKKLAIADRMALFADPVFADPAMFSTSAVWLGLFAYTLQLYCDFSGYSDMAVGLAHLFGYKLPRNFNLPYLAPNLAEFWRRWHITLTGWLRDYVFIPLGGSRSGFWKTSRNIAITMLLVGIWHGANWTFVLFGLIQATLLIVERVFRQWCQRRPALDAALNSVPGTIGRTMLTFFVFMVTMVFIRSPNLEIVCSMYDRMLAFDVGSKVDIAKFSLLAAGVLVLVPSLLCLRNVWPRMARRLPAPILGLGYMVVFTLALMYTPPAGKVFIYFQF